MNVIIDIGHPAHVHLFKHLAWKLQAAGGRVLFTLREKEHEKALLERYGFEYVSFGRKYRSAYGKLAGMFTFGYREWQAGRKFRADLFISHGSMYAAHAAALLRKPHIALEDTGNREQILLYKPFSRVILSPETIGINLGPKHILYPGSHELAHLHPDNFTPDPGIFDWLGLPAGADFAIVRFVSLGATHDMGAADWSMAEKLRFVQQLEKRLPVFVSTESPENTPLSPYAINIPPEKIHDVLAFARLYVGNGATMAAEAGVLGTPTIYIESVKARKCEGLEKYRLVEKAGDFSSVWQLVNRLLSNPKLREEWAARRQQFLEKNINLSTFLYWFVSQYPESETRVRNDAGIWQRFLPREAGAGLVTV